jgi:uncharacterized phage protein (TIGR01671 family)
VREIKFRVWFVPSSKMYFGVNVISTPNQGVALEKYKDGDRSRENLRFYSPLDEECILMQFTCVRDKNGREIYEGDIVRWNHGADQNDNGVHAVEFRGGAYCLADPARYALRVFCRPFGGDVAERIEVLGNIYENPELLQSKRDGRINSSQQAPVRQSVAS